MDRVVRVLPDVSGLDREFDYLMPEPWAARVTPGDLVRVDLNRRRVAGWVTAVDVEPPTMIDAGGARRAIALRPVSKWSSVGPDAETVDLARWAAHRWHGRLRAILRTASPDTMVAQLDPRPRSGPQVLPASLLGPVGELVATALAEPGPTGVGVTGFGVTGFAVTVVRVPPAAELFGAVVAAARCGDAIVVVPDVGEARMLGGRLRRAGGAVALAGRDFARGAAGGVVIGGRRAVWSRVAALAAVVVLDEHAEALQEERNPTWHAREVAIERARRAGVPVVLVSPCPTAAALAVADRVLSLPRSEERAGWPAVVVADRRREDPARAVGMFSPTMVAQIRGGATGRERVVCVLNRKGRARMLVCTTCGELVTTLDGATLMAEVDHAFVSPGGETRPKVCASCGATGFRRLRLGVTRVREELEALIREPVAEITGDAMTPDADRCRVLVGTEAVLHRVADAGLVVFCDFDQELLAPRYRGAEQAMALLIRAGRLVGGRTGGGRILVQTRQVEHRVLRAAVLADPAGFARDELALRQSLGFPPFGALAEVASAGAGEALAPLFGRDDLGIMGPNDGGAYLVRAESPDILAGALSELAPTKARVRVAVDPPRA